MKKILSIIVLAILLLPTKVMAEENADKIHFIYVGGSNAFLLESNGEYMLIDSGNPSDETAKALFNEHKYSEGWTFTSRGIDGNGVVNYIQNTLGVTHLDYVLASHAHWDHNGGMYEVANSSLVDENTKYIYKKYVTIANEEQNNWFNGWFYNRALQAFKRKGSTLIDVTTLNKKAASYGMTYYNNSNILSNNARFMLGNFNISLYNLNTISNKSDNMNSIVIYANNGIHDALFMSDMQITGDGLEYGYYAWANVEKDLINEISKDTGAVDVLQLGHHGSYTSNGSELIMGSSPIIAIASSGGKSAVNKQFNALHYYFEDTGTKLYSTIDSDEAIVVNMSEYTPGVYNGDTGVAMEEASITNLKTSGWVTWSYRGGKTDDYYNKWMYIKNGTLAKGWQNISNKWYYFSSAGIMQTGWLKEKGNWYYLNSNGVMTTGWVKSDNKWYYLNKSGIMQTGWEKVGSKYYYLNNSGVMTTGWQKVKSKWYYMNGSGVMQANKWIGNYYVEASGAMATNKWIGKYHVNASGKLDKTK